MKGQTLIPSRPHADNSPPKIIDCCVTVYVHLGECYHPINIISPDTYRRAYKMLQHCMYCFIILSPTVDCCIIYLPPPFKDIPNIYSASPARKPICALSMPPPSSPSSTKRPFNVFTQNTAWYHPRKSDGVRSCFHRAFSCYAAWTEQGWRGPLWQAYDDERAWGRATQPQW
jgi:hypothetical protein